MKKRRVPSGGRGVYDVGVLFVLKAWFRVVSDWAARDPDCPCFVCLLRRADDFLVIDWITRQACAGGVKALDAVGLEGVANRPHLGNAANTLGEADIQGKLHPTLH